MSTKRVSTIVLTVAFLSLSAVARGEPVGTAFTYQAQLKQADSPVNDTCDFEFSLWDEAGTGDPPTGGNQIGPTITIVPGVTVTNGLFTVQLNENGEFGPDAFNGSARWLQIAVRCPPDPPGNYTTLSPRHPITATPYARVAARAGGRTVDIRDYGANGDDDQDDTLALEAAIVALSANDTLLIPRSSAEFRVAINANLTISVPGVKVIVRGNVRATGTPTENTRMFNVTADDCQFIGEGGMLEGSGQYIMSIPENEHAQYGPALIRFDGSNGSVVRSLRLRNGPRSSVVLHGCSRSKIIDCHFEGGPLAYTFQVFGVFFIGATDLLIKGNQFLPGADGGKVGSWVLNSATSSNHYVTIVANQFGGCHDHAVYCNGLFNSVVSDNVCHDAGSSSIKTNGTDNVIANNNIKSLGVGGIEAANASRCIIANNIIDQFGFVGIIAYQLGTGFDGEYTDNIITGNQLRAAESGIVYEGIRILVPTTCSRSKITDNIIYGAGRDGDRVAIWVESGAPSHAISIRGNTLWQCAGDGIRLGNVNAGIISDNIVQVQPGRLHLIEPGECDDGSQCLVGGDPCADGSSCSSTNLVVDNQFIECENTCGDGVIEPCEECDDGGQCDDGSQCFFGGDPCADGSTCTPMSEDGCDAACQTELCGDGIVQAGLGEVCDDGWADECGGCNANCSGPGTWTCGDGVLCRETEECDDGNTDPGDGCDENCQSE